MQRSPGRLELRVYDLVVIGGGIHGAMVAWDAVLRGLSVALIEKGDFGHATSANSLKIVHGGFRHLKNGDLKAVREGVTERTNWMRMAPGLVRPLPVLIPVYAHKGKSRLLFSLALKVYDLMSLDRNWRMSADGKIPNSSVISRGEVLSRFPDLDNEGLTGGALFYDAQVSNTDRLTFSVVQSAAERGADVINYCEVSGLLVDSGEVRGVRVTDRVSGREFKIRAKAVVNASGPWVNRIWSYLNGYRPSRRIPLVKAMNVVIRRPVADTAVGVYVRDRYLFMTPWRGHALVGTSQSAFDGDPDTLSITAPEVDGFCDEFRTAFPGFAFTKRDIVRVHRGLVPAADHPTQAGKIDLARRHEIYDHDRTGLKGLISVLGVKYTGACRAAEHVVTRVFEKLRMSAPRSITDKTALTVGEIPHFGHRAQLVDCVQNEMTVHLSDLIFRRTELGGLGYPGDDCIEDCAHVMAKKWSWDKTRVRAEIAQVEALFARDWETA